MSLFGPESSLRRVARRWGYPAYQVVRGSLLDTAERLSGRPRHPLTPPRRLWHLITSSGNDFHTSGAEIRDFLVSVGLRPDHRVLDVGCGIGRLAVALTGYLSPAGAYEGFDIMPAAIRWCRNINARHPNFRFQLVNLKSDRYHPSGSNRSSDFRFPYPDDTFDFVVLSSVFTHMFPADMRNYLDQIQRVLKPGGRCVISYYLMNPERRVSADEGRSVFGFRHPGEGYWAEFADMPEAAIAHDEADVLAAFAERKLRVVSRFGGEWAHTPVQSQDVLVAVKD